MALGVALYWERTFPVHSRQCPRQTVRACDQRRWCANTPSGTGTVRHLFGNVERATASRPRPRVNLGVRTFDIHCPLAGRLLACGPETSMPGTDCGKTTSVMDPTVPQIDLNSELRRVWLGFAHPRLDHLLPFPVVDHFVTQSEEMSALRFVFVTIGDDLTFR